MVTDLIYCYTKWCHHTCRQGVNHTYRSAFTCWWVPTYGLFSKVLRVPLLHCFYHPTPRKEKRHYTSNIQHPQILNTLFENMQLTFPLFLCCHFLPLHFYVIPSLRLHLQDETIMELKNWRRVIEMIEGTVGQVTA